MFCTLTLNYCNVFVCLFFFSIFFSTKIFILLITPFHFLYALTTAKGRTNIELREQFILADGVSQSMSAFKPKHNAQQQRSGSTAGPITKVKWLISVSKHIMHIYCHLYFEQNIIHCYWWFINNHPSKIKHGFKKKKKTFVVVVHFLRIYYTFR